MYIKHLELNKYKRLYVPGIKNVDYTPNKSIQIILASNGSGKSSLLKEIVPNVEELTTEYDTGGYRTATYVHNGSVYILSYSRDNNRHSFIRDNEELNQAGLKKIQKILIEEHFGLTKPIHEMLLSINTFTNMSVSERKRWFTNILTSIDYEYAMDMYNKTKLVVKDTTSYIKLTQSKILNYTEQLKTHTPERVKHLKEDKEMFNDIIETLINKKTNPSLTDAPDLDKLKDKTRHLTTLLASLSPGTKKDDAELKVYHLTRQTEDIDNSLKEIDSKLKKINTLNIDDVVNTTKLEEELLKINDDINSHAIRIGVPSSMLLSASNDYRAIYGDLIYTANELAEVSDIDTSHRGTIADELTSASTQLVSVRADILQLDKAIYTQVHNGNQDNVTCPKCSHEFKPNFNKELLQHLKKELTTLTQQEQELDKVTARLNDELVKIDTKLRLLLTFRKYFTTDALKHLLTHIDSLTNGMDDLSNLTGILSNLTVMIPEPTRIEELITRAVEIEQKLVLHKKLTVEKLNHITVMRDALLKDRTNLITTLNNITKDLTSLRKELAIVNKIVVLTPEVRHATHSVTMYKKYLYQYELDKYINSVIYEAKKVIVGIDEELNEFARLSKLIEELTEDLNNYQSELVAAKKLEEYLSPNKGIIGESISKTINVVIEKMNFIINKIWTYEIKIQPCFIDSNDLTFRFPVIINSTKDIPDVSKGSSSIKEIIDLAFKITAMELLDMLDYPLILDEFGKTLDTKHQISAYEYIEELGKHNFSQIFMVSHFESMYSRFANTDVVVLNNDNINYSNEYNTVIKIR